MGVQWHFIFIISVDWKSIWPVEVCGGGAFVYAIQHSQNGEIKVHNMYLE